MLKRREFLKLVSAGMGSMILAACHDSRDRSKIPITFLPLLSTRGHEVWKQQVQFIKRETVRVKTMIIGAGISGLSAAWNLKKNGESDFLIIELADNPGGNSASGQNAYGAFPLGAHYITLPNPSNDRLTAFLHEMGIITGFDEKGRSVFNETDLCFDPEERLFIKGTFQEGLVPSLGTSEKTQEAFGRFFSLMNDFRSQKGSDGLYFFDIPRRLCSADTRHDHLDAITFREYLKNNAFNDDHLLWYTDYCCRDDFGGGIDKVSAWTGIHYFAAHRADPSNTDGSRVLTWPEGNGRLVRLLSAETTKYQRNGVLAKRISVTESGVAVTAIDFKNSTILNVECEKCIVAIPPFVTARVLDKSLPYPFEKAKALQHSPWLVATITLSRSPGGRGLELCWDNVPYNGRSLGYIYDQHQSLEQLQTKCLISLYIPIDHLPPADARKWLSSRSEAELRNIVLTELSNMHTDIESDVEAIEICEWGHGMVLPSLGVARGADIRELSKTMEDRIFFAHSDLAAYSTFEEAFDQGMEASFKILKRTS